MVFLTSELWFPDPRSADDSGILAIGGDLSVERVLLAYYNGIFPWYDDESPILWWSPDERMVLFPEKLHISKSMKRILKQEYFSVSFNKSFNDVIEKCSKVKRREQNGTWLTEDMIETYKKLHKLGIAHSVEAWKDRQLVGGLYGIYLKDKGLFCGESMFSLHSNASKFAFIKMIQRFKLSGLKLVDCQVYTSHLESLGGELIDREAFLSYLDI